MSEEQLIRACAESNDGAAWDEFVCRFRRAISLSIIRTAYQWGQAPRQVVDDLVQESHLNFGADRRRRVRGFPANIPSTVPVSDNPLRAQDSQRTLTAVESN